MNKPDNLNVGDRIDVTIRGEVVVLHQNRQQITLRAEGGLVEGCLDILVGELPSASIHDNNTLVIYDRCGAISPVYDDVGTIYEDAEGSRYMMIRPDMEGDALVVTDEGEKCSLSRARNEFGPLIRKDVQ